MSTKSRAILVFLIIVTSFCCFNIASSQIKISGLRNYTDLIFRSLPKTVVDSFFNHSRCKQVLVEPDYHVWCLSVIKWEGKYHAYYSRWNKKYGFEGWLTHSEVAHAVSSTPEGPFEFVNVVLQNQKKEGWDINNSHNPYAIVSDGRIYLYYISNDIKASFKNEKSKIDYPDSIWFVQNRTLIRNSQCIGIATADNPSGPFIRSGEAIVKPDNIKFKNIAVNPAVIHRNNKYTMIMKGDDVNHEEWFRIQLVGFSDKPSGPFDFALKPVYNQAQTEDACIWFDNVLKKYYMVCHVMGKSELAFFNSADGIDWQPDNREMFMKKEFTLSDGTIWKPKRVERPFVLTDDTGKPIMIYLAVLDKNVSGNIAVSIEMK